MIETLLAVLVITFAFLGLFRLSRLLTGKILAEHAALRVARARAVGLNDFMCRKAARIALLPVSGECLWPAGPLPYPVELARCAVYLQTPDSSVAQGVLDYDGWHHLRVEPGDGTDVRVALDMELLDEARVTIEGRAGIERNFPDYMMDGGR